MIDNLMFIDAQELLMTPVNKPQFLVDDLIPSGVSIIAGDEKAGKSWMMLHLALCVAQGKDFLGHHVNQGTVFYLSLEDSIGRLQDRLFELADEMSFGKLYLSTKCASLADGLIEQLTRIYADIAKIKEFAMEYGLSIFLVHHLRKQGDSRNMFNRFNGTKGITGAVDTMFLLDKENEYSDKATLCIKGRDLQYRELTIRFTDFKWELISEKTLEQISQEHTPEIMFTLIDFLKERRSWRGSATELLEELGDKSVAPNVLTKYVNQYRLSLLLDEGIEYTYRRNHSEGRVLSFQICDGCDGRDGQEDYSR